MTAWSPQEAALWESHPAFFFPPVCQLFTALERDCGIESIWEPGVSAEESQRRFRAYLAQVVPARERLRQGIVAWLTLLYPDWLHTYLESGRPQYSESLNKKALESPASGDYLDVEQIDDSHIHP